jgi:hypothetical protein
VEVFDLIQKSLLSSWRSLRLAVKFIDGFAGEGGPGGGDGGLDLR